MSKNISLDLTEGSVIKVQLNFFYPIMLANLLETAYNMVDMVVVGRFLGSNALSAVSIGSDIMQMINLTCNGLAAGAQILIAQYMGAKDRDAINKSVGTFLSTFIIIALSLTIILQIFAVPILRFMNTPAESWHYAVNYTTTCYCGLLAIFGYSIIGAMLRGMGDSRHPLLFIGITSVVNLVLDMLFVVVFHMGTFGAALATVIGQGMSFIWALHFLYRRQEQFGLSIRLASLRPDRKILPGFFKVALPISLQNAVLQCATLYTNSFVFAYGVAVTSISGIGTKLASISHIITNALVRSGASMVGQNIAAGKVDRVKKVFLFNALGGLFIATFLSLMTVFFRETVFGIFTTDRAVLELTALYMPIIIMKYFYFGSRAPSMALINGIGLPKINMMIAIFDGFVFRVGLSLLLGTALGMGLIGYWYGPAIGGFVPICIAVPYFISGKWKNEQLVTNGRLEHKVSGDL